MKKKHDSLKRRIRWAFIFGVAAVLLVAQLIVSAVEIILTKTGIIPQQWRIDKTVLSTLIWGFSCIIIGSGITVLISNFILKPMNDLLDGVSRLADGDYSVRLDIGRRSAVNSVSKSVNHLAEELEKTEILRSDFVNSFSHEFKTPINSINGLISLMKKGKLSKAKQLEYLNIIEDETHRLSAMTTNILNLSKLENQGVLAEKKVYNVSEQIRMCILLLERKWSNKEIELSIDFDEFDVYGNEEMLQQVWVNLIDNAIKFASKKGQLNIRINKINSYVCIDIENTGSEIKSEDKERIFTKFYQSDKSHAKGGNGIGLSIVKRIVDLHDGLIEVNSGNNITCFKVYLPID